MCSLPRRMGQSLCPRPLLVTGGAYGEVLEVSVGLGVTPGSRSMMLCVLSLRFPLSELYQPCPWFSEHCCAPCASAVALLGYCLCVKTEKNYVFTVALNVLVWTLVATSPTSAARYCQSCCGARVLLSREGNCAVGKIFSLLSCERRSVRKLAAQMPMLQL